MTQPLALVTGASGFIGRHVVQSLIERGYRVRAGVHHCPVTVPGVENVALDLETASDLSAAVSGCELVVHSAALLDPVPSEERAERVNHLGTLQLARAADGAGVGCFVFLSTMAVLGPRAQRGPIPPSAAPRPTTAYGRSKLAAERALGELQGPMRIAILRPPTVYGPGERRNFLALVRAVDSGLFLVPGRGDARMSFCWLGTLGAAVCWAAESERARSILHVADPPVTLRHAAQTIAEVLGRRLPPIPFPMLVARAVALVCEGAFRPIGIPPPLSRARLATLTNDAPLDTSDTEKLGFRVEDDFSAHVRETIGWYQREGLLKPAARRGVSPR